MTPIQLANPSVCPNVASSRLQIPIKTAAANRLLQGFHKRRDLEAVFKVRHGGRTITAAAMLLCFGLQCVVTGL